MDAFLTLGGFTALISLTVMEVVLGIDNIVFIAILVSKVSKENQQKVRTFGLLLALVARLGLLFSITWVIGLTRPLFSLFEHAYAGRDLIFLFGGLFLIAKATFEIHDKLEGPPDKLSSGYRNASTFAILVQIILLDLVFSLDSVVTAVGMVQEIPIMVAAMVIAVAVMLAFSERISGFVNEHPTLKMLALSFLLLIGVVLVADGLGVHIPKGYVYFAMAFSLGVELLNLKYRSRNSGTGH